MAAQPEGQLIAPLARAAQCVGLTSPLVDRVQCGELLDYTLHQLAITRFAFAGASFGSVVQIDTVLMVLSDVASSQYAHR
ncbi:hypothetical protein [Microbacterium sp. SS28]|uniref:hypothetical protein n=1 Tax=Microbacterium sp. SS28 TaxID=2919948 RepID=UPI001FA9852B|nr:hypothetical protein [Microbacterium sp. SS28]